MKSFRTFLLERAGKAEVLAQRLRRLGFAKQKPSTRTTILVYVPASERAVAMQTLSKGLPGSRVDQSPTTMRKISSLGAIVFDRGPYRGMMVGVKPDKSGGLNTDEQETLAGIFIITKHKSPRTKFSFKDLQTSGDANTISKYKINDLYEKAGKGWLTSATTIANTFARYLTRGANYTVHQRSGSKFEKNISTAAKTLIAKAGHRMGLDKWNPADIWIVKSGYENTDFSQFDTIIELNSWLVEQFNAKNVLGVSLKQVGTRANVEVYNSGVKEKKEFIKVIQGKTGFVNALNIDVEFDSGSMVIRNFGRPESVSGEINGKFAQGGKVGSGPLFNIIKRFDSSFDTKTHQEISTMYENNPKQVYDHLYNQMKKLDKDTASKYNREEYEKAIEAKKNTMNYIISRWQCSDISHSLNGMKKEQRDDFINAALGYASSSTEISSIFYKVS